MSAKREENYNSVVSFMGRRFRFDPLSAQDVYNNIALRGYKKPSTTPAKKPEYGPRARKIEKATLTAAVMSISCGMGKEMDVLVRPIPTKLSVERGERYSERVGFVEEESVSIC